MLFIPKQFAHGFLTLSDATEIEYLFDEVYEPGSEGGINYADPDLGIEWPRSDRGDRRPRPVAAAVDRLASRRAFRASCALKPLGR